MFAARYGQQLPDDDAGREDAALVAHHLAAVGDGKARITAWLALRAPWMPPADVLALISAIEAKRLRWRADTLAARLNLTAAERRALRITTIGAVDETSEERAAARAQRSRVAKLQKRRAAGARPREEYEGTALSRLAPWLAIGVSRRTWERRRATTANCTRCAPSASRN